MFLDFVRHAPGRFVSDGQLTLNLARRHALVPCAIEKHHIKPVLQGRAAARERCPRFRVNVISAPLADKCMLLTQAVKLTHAGALGTRAGITEAEFQQMIEAGVFGREALREDAVKDGFGVGGGHSDSQGLTRSIRKGAKSRVFRVANVSPYATAVPPI